MTAAGEDEGAYSRTADAESVVLNFANVLTYSRVLLYTLKEGRAGGISAKKKEEIVIVGRPTTHTVSGASLSLFSSRYLTSEIRRQPALLNSGRRNV